MDLMKKRQQKSDKSQEEKEPLIGESLEHKNPKEAKRDSLIPLQDTDSEKMPEEMRNFLAMITAAAPLLKLYQSPDDNVEEHQFIQE